MAIDINNGPALGELFGTKEPLVFNLATDQFVIDAAGIHFINIIYNTLPSVGATMTYNVNEVSGTITFVASNPTALTQCLAPPAGMTRLVFLETILIPFLRTLPAFEDCDFRLVGPSQILRIEFLTPGLNQQVITHSGYNVTQTVVDGQDLQVQADYYVAAQIMLTDVQVSSFYSVRSPWYLFRPEAVGTDGFLELDLSRLVEELIPEDDLWALDDNAIAPVVKGVRRCLVRFEERINGNRGVFKLSNRFQVLKGGREIFAINKGIYNTHVNLYLTSRPKVYTDVRMSDWLYFIHNGTMEIDGSKLNMYVLIVDALGVEHKRVIGEIPTLEAGTVVKIPSGYNQLALDVQNPVMYKVNIGYLNEIQNSILDLFSISYHVIPEGDFVSSLQYYNSFGLLESVLIKSSSEVINEYERRTQYVQMPVQRSTTDHPELAHDVYKEMIFKTATVAMDKESWAAAGDIYLSKKHYFVQLIDSQRDQPKRHAVYLEKDKIENQAYNPDGNGFASVPLSLRFPITRVNSTPYSILDL
jgi:hypothetical protein